MQLLTIFVQCQIWKKKQNKPLAAVLIYLMIIVIMKFLTGITIIFSVPTMIASFLGMNVPLGSIGESDISFILIVIISSIVSFILACWLKKKNML